jgi:hypothetical protein
MKIVFGIILGFAFGFLTHCLLSGQPSTKQHWKVVESYNAFVSNPSNYKPDAATGLSFTTPPAGPESSLAALVAAGALTHADLVLPSVPYSREAEQYFLKFAHNHKEIVYFTGNPQNTALKPAGVQPLHLNIWYKDAGESVVQALLRELEETYGKKAA